MSQLVSPVHKLKNSREYYSDGSIERYNSHLKNCLKETPRETLKNLRRPVENVLTDRTRRANEATAVAVLYREQGLKKYSEEAEAIAHDNNSIAKSIRIRTPNQFSTEEMAVVLKWPVIQKLVRKALKTWQKNPEYVALCTLMCLDNGGYPRRDEYKSLSTDGENSYRDGKITLRNYKMAGVYDDYVIKVKYARPILDYLVETNGPKLFTVTSMAAAFKSVVGVPLGCNLLRKLCITHWFSVDPDNHAKFVEMTHKMGHSIQTQKDDYQFAVQQYNTIGDKITVKWSPKYVEELESLASKYGPNDIKAIMANGSRELVLLNGVRNGLKMKMQNLYVTRVNKGLPVGPLEGIDLTPTHISRLNPKK